MIIDIDPRSGVPIYRQIIEQVRRQILTGQMAVGEQLEQVRSLAARLKVNPMTVSKAYGYLELEGLVERQRGIGLFVAHVRKDVKKPMKTRMVEQALKEAAALAVGMDVSDEDAWKLYEKYCRQYRSKRRRNREER